MYPILYSADETDFTHNGLGILRDSTSATVTEERNGIFELHMEYDSDGPFADIIDYDMIIKAKANDKQDLQLFRIYAINKSQENDNIKIDAQHITYDLAGNFVEKLELDNATAATAMATIQNNLAYATKFTISSDNNTTTSTTKLYRTNPLQMIGGVDGSIIDNWGGEIERDNFRLILHAKRGSNDGAQVSYGKNLTGLEAKFDVSNVVTRIFPFKILEDGTVITIPGKYIDSQNINVYSFIRILPVDYSQDEDVTDQDSLYAKSSTYFSNGSDRPTVTMEVSFESLWQTEEYKDVAALEYVGMCDTITVHNKKMNIDATANVIKIEYDVISEKNSKVKVGDPTTSLTSAVNSQNDNVQAGINQAIDAANTAILAANGKNKIFYGPDEPIDANGGDVWFKVVDGEYTRTYHFDGIQWQLVVDADTNQAKMDAANAISIANGAVNTANQATQDAQSAMGKAQQGFDAAQDALMATDSLANRMTDAEGNISALQQTANSFAARISDAEGNISTLTQTTSGLQTAVSGKVDTTTYNSFVTQTNSALQSKLNVTDAANTYATQSSLTQTASSLQSAIDEKVDEDIYNSKISQLSSDINLRVQKNDVINQINISTEGILIGGDKVHITGQTTIDNAVITSAMIQSIDAAKITTGTLDASKVSVINLSASNIKSGTLYSISIEGSTVKSSDTPSYDDATYTNRAMLNNGMLQVQSRSNLLGAYGSVEIANGRARAKGVPGELTLPPGYTPPSSNYTDYGSGYIYSLNDLYISAGNTIIGDLYSPSFKFTPSMFGGTLTIGDLFSIAVNTILSTVTMNGVNGISITSDIDMSNHALNNVNNIVAASVDTKATHIYVRPIGGGELRVTTSGSTTTYENLRANLIYGNAVDINTGKNVYIRPASGGEVRCTATGSTTTYVTIRAKNFAPDTSLRENKKDIEIYDDPGVLDMFRSSNVYTYLRKYEEPDAFKQLGLMIDETPRLLHGETGDYMDLYATISYVWKGVKDTLVIVDENVQKLADIESRYQIVQEQNENLILKVADLEQRLSVIEKQVA